MSVQNDVCKVLVTTGNQAILPVANSVTDLAPGQIGVFDANTNVSIDGSDANRNFYLAVGLDLDGDTVTDDIMKSSGSHIQNKNIKFYSFRPHTPGNPMIAKVGDYLADCETEYAVKFEFRNQEIYANQGFNQFTKTFNMVTGCCTKCDTGCNTADPNEITQGLKVAINVDEAGMIVARAIARHTVTIATHGTVANYAIGDEVTDADVVAMIAYNAGETDETLHVFTDLEVETVPLKLQAFGNINLQYFYPRQTVVLPVLSEGLDCNGTMTITTPVKFEEGSGYDVKQLEYYTKGFTESPYRVSTLNGLADEKTYIAQTNVKYDMFSLTHDQFSTGAWLEYLHNQATLIAVPATDTITRDGLVAVLDALIVATNGFDPLADDVALANVNPAVSEPTEDIDNVEGDGIA